MSPAKRRVGGSGLRINAEGPLVAEPIVLPSVAGVDWADDVEAEAWHADSQIPPSEVLSEIPEEGGANPLDFEPQEDEPDLDDDEDCVTELGAAEDPSEGRDVPVAQPDDSARGRSKTIARKQMLRERRRMLAQGTLPEIIEYERPMTRGECREAARPCLFVSCRYHLYLDVNPVTGSIKINFPDREVWELKDTCALDVSARGGITLEEVGEIMNLTRERIRQVEVTGLVKLRRGDARLHTFIDGKELLERFDDLPLVEELPATD